MDNLNSRFKRVQNRRERKAVDGIIQPRNNRGSIDFRRSTYYQPGNGQMADFSQPEGFNQAEQGIITANADTGGGGVAAMEQPLKPGFFARSKKKPKRAKEHHGLGKRKWLKVVRKSLTAITVAVMITGSFLFGKAFLKARNIFKGGSQGAIALQENVDPSKLKSEGDGRVNILLLGKGGEGHTAPDLTDTILILSIDPLQKEAAILSVPRDLYVKVPGDGSMKINAVYASGKSTVLASGRQTDELKARAEKNGFDAVEKTLKETLGIPIHYHVMVDFDGFERAVNTVGGVDLNVPSSVYEVMRIDGKQYTLNVKPGQQHFDGFRALAYVRSRYTSPRGDFDRAERQRLVILALKDRIFSLGTFANPIKISQLLDAFGNHIETNMTIDEMMSLYALGKDIPGNKVSSLGLADPPNNFVKTGNINGLSVVIPTAGVGNFKEIQNFVRNTLKDGYLKNENASVMVLNGTSTPGVAGLKADELKSYGYNVSQVGDAPTKNYTKTVLVDLRGGAKKYTKRYLEQRFFVAATTNLPAGVNAGGADFVIILGTNATKSQN